MNEDDPRGGFRAVTDIRARLKAIPQPDGDPLITFGWDESEPVTFRDQATLAQFIEGARASAAAACEFEQGIHDQTHDHWCRVHGAWRDDHPEVDPVTVCSCLGHRAPPHKPGCPLAASEAPAAVAADTTLDDDCACPPPYADCPHPPPGPHPSEVLPAAVAADPATPPDRRQR